MITITKATSNDDNKNKLTNNRGQQIVKLGIENNDICQGLSITVPYVASIWLDDSYYCSDITEWHWGMLNV